MKLRNKRSGKVCSLAPERKRARNAYIPGLGFTQKSFLTHSGYLTIGDWCISKPCLESVPVRPNSSAYMDGYQAGMSGSARLVFSSLPTDYVREYQAGYSEGLRIRQTQTQRGDEDCNPFAEIRCWLELMKGTSYAPL